MNLKNRLDKLERGYPKHWTLKNMTDDELAQLITGNPDAKASDLTDDILRKLTLAPVRATAKENNQSIAEATAGELGMPFGDFKKALRLRARGKDTS